MLNRQWLFLAFHCVVSIGDPRAQHHLSCTEDRFRSIVRHLKATGYEFMTCSQFFAVFNSGDACGRKIAVLSFDDGYSDNWLAAQILIKEGGVGTFFPIACTLEGKLPVSRLIDLAAEKEGFSDWLDKIQTNHAPVGGPRNTPFPKETLSGRAKGLLASAVPLSEVVELVGQLEKQFLQDIDQGKCCREVYLLPSQLHAISGLGMEIGNHTYRHCRLDGQTPKDIMLEIEQAERVFSRAGLAVPTSLALPYGGAQSASLWSAMSSKNKLSWWGYCEYGEPEEFVVTCNGVCLFERMDQRFFQI